MVLPQKSGHEYWGQKRRRRLGYRLMPLKGSSAGMHLVDGGAKYSGLSETCEEAGVEGLSHIPASQKDHYLGELDRRLPVMIRVTPTRKPTRPSARPRAQTRVSVVSGSGIVTWGSQCVKSGSSRPQCSTLQS